MVANDVVQDESIRMLLKALRCRQDADQKDRRDPALRIEMVKVIGDLQDLILEHATALSCVKGDASALEVDHASDLIVWQLCEFLTQGAFLRGDDSSEVLKGFQVSERHAFDHFDVDRTVLSDELVAEAPAPLKT